MELYFNSDLINHIVLQTNLYAQQYIDANHENLKPHSRVRDWYETDEIEMKQFLALVFLMGLVKMPTMEHYWQKKVFYRHPLFGRVMKRNRFQLLMKFLHFNDNSKMPQPGSPGHDRLYKIRPVIDHLHEKFQEVYTPRGAICVDESLLLWKGRLIFRQYIPLKRARYGIKLFLCCESDGEYKGSGGYCFRLRIYSGKDGPTTDITEVLPDDAKHLSISEQAVVFLIRPLLDKGYTVYMDNWYSSLRLYLYLLERQTLACGTIDRGFPPELRPENPPPGCASVALCGDSKVVATKFVSTKDVHMLSTAHGHEELDVPNRQRNGTIRKPLAVVEYNRNMGGVDKEDQLIEPYSITRKTLKWSKKIFFHLMQMASCNAFIIAKKDGYDKVFLDFIESVAASWMFPDYEAARAASEAALEGSDDEVRLTERHFPSPIPPTDKKLYPSRVCIVCSKKGFKRKETRNHCPDCPSKPPLCLPECYKIYHTQFRYY